MSEQKNNTGDIEVLSFRHGAEEYGISILAVQEIRGYEAVTRIAPASRAVVSRSSPVKLALGAAF